MNINFRSLFSRKKKPLSASIEKLDRLLITPIDLRKLYSIQCYFVFGYIDIWTNELEYILEQDIFQDMKITKFSSSEPNLVNFIYGLSQDGRVPEEPIERITKFLQVSRQLLIRYYTYKDTRAGPELSSNLRLIQPHIIYIEDMIEKIYQILLNTS